MATFDSGRGLVRAAAEQIFGPVAIPAQDLKTVLGETLSLQPRIKNALATSAKFQPVRLTIIVDMVYRQKITPRFPATDALIAICRKDLHLEALSIKATTQTPTALPASAFIRLAMPTEVKFLKRFDLTTQGASSLAAVNGPLLARASRTDLVAPRPAGGYDCATGPAVGGVSSTKGLNGGKRTATCAPPSTWWSLRPVFRLDSTPPPPSLIVNLLARLAIAEKAFRRCFARSKFSCWQRRLTSWAPKRSGSLKNVLSRPARPSGFCHITRLRDGKHIGIIRLYTIGFKN